MSDDSTKTASAAGNRVVLSIDAMGGDGGVGAIVKGMAKSARKNPDLCYIVHGDETALKRWVARHKELSGRCEIRQVDKTIAMDAKPSHVMRNGKGSSMWNAIDSVAQHEADVAVSCGNTGALMALSMLRLRKIEGVNRPAIAVLWPSRNQSGYTVMLDVGADIRADAEDLLQYAIMGASYARNGLKIAAPRIGLLNVGTEENKGRPELQKAATMLEAAQGYSDFQYVGFVEGNDIPSDKVDIIVTDGFTGNIALKTAEGTAQLIRDFLKQAFEYSFLSRIGAMFAFTAMRRLSKRIDPRRVNGGVFLGLNGTVVKSHGGSDSTSVSAAIKLAFRLARQGFAERLATRVASGLEASKTMSSANSEE